MTNESLIEKLEAESHPNAYYMMGLRRAIAIVQHDQPAPSVEPQEYQARIRLEFESVWAKNPALVPLDKGPSGRYICIVTAVAWESFLAGKASMVGAKPPEQPDDRADFWKAEYCSLARAGVEKMAELGVEVDSAERMIEAAEYRQSKLPMRESGEFMGMKIVEDGRVPPGEIWLRDKKNNLLGKIINIGGEGE